MAVRTGTLDADAPAVRSIQARARRTADRTVRAGAEAYDRVRDLPRLARIDPRPLESIAGAELIVARLSGALRAERNRARSGHWTYDLNRHIALRQAYLAESEHLEGLRNGTRDQNPEAGRS